MLRTTQTKLGRGSTVTEWTQKFRSHVHTLSRLVYALMSRRTDRQASVPLFTKRTISMEGTRSMTIFARTFSSSHGAPYDVPCTSASGLVHAYVCKLVHPNPYDDSSQLPAPECIMLTQIALGSGGTKWYGNYLVKLMLMLNSKD